MNLILFILVCYGLTNAITKELVFKWFRDFVDKYFPYSILKKIINCPTCCSFWVGLLISLIYPILTLNVIYCGLISSASINIIQKIIEYKF